MSKHHVSTISVVLFLISILAIPASAQLESGIGASLTGASSAAYYYISKPGEITMPVNLWGYVKNPGRYEVPISTDLIQLVSYAGGPLADADMGSVKITRVVRREDAIRKVEYSVNLNHLDKLDDKALNLEPGDTIYIESVSFKVADIFNFITTAAIITASIANVISVTRTR